VLVDTVDVATETAHARDDTVGAGGALGESLLDGGAVVADAEGVGADADESAFFGARGRAARRGVVATGVGVAGRCGCGSLARGSCHGGGSGGEGGVGLLLLLVVVRLDLRGDLIRRTVCGCRGSRSGVGGSGGRGRVGGNGGRGRVCRSRGLLGGGVTASSVAAGDSGLGEVVTVGSAHRGDKLARLREENVGVLRGLDIVDTRQVGDEEGREDTVARATRDVDVDAVLVHLAVAPGVEPSPRKDGVAGLDTLRHRDVPRVHTIALVGRSASLGSVGVALAVCIEVALGVGRAATLDGVDDAPAGGVGSVGGVGKDCELAATSSVHSSVGTVGQFELEREGLASDQLLAAGSGKSSTVAGEVAAAGVKRVFDGVALDWHRLSEEHVGVGHAHEGSDHDGGEAEGGDRVEVVHVCGVRFVRTGSEFSECVAIAGS
jgi:hypothetical protein